MELDQALKSLDTSLQTNGHALLPIATCRVNRSTELLSMGIPDVLGKYVQQIPVVAQVPQRFREDESVSVPTEQLVAVESAHQNAGQW